MRTKWTASLLVLLAVTFFVPFVYAASPPELPSLPGQQSAPQAPPGQQGRQMDQGHHGLANIPAGTAVTVRTDSQIAIGTAKTGDIFPATLDEDILASGKTVVRKGAPAEIRLMKVREDQDELAFKLYSLTVDGKQTRVVSDTAREVARKSAPQQQQQSGLGGALGQVVGGALGTGQGLTWSGAAKQDAKVPAGTFLEFTLREQVNLGK